jgi:uncharacterized protein YcfJ
MRLLALTTATALAALAPLAHAQYDRPYDRDGGYYQPIPDTPAPPRYRDGDRDRRGGWTASHARVTHSQPVYAEAASHEECWNEETRSYERRDRIAGTALGALAGGVIGHQFSDRGTAAGAVIGGIVGNQVARHRDDDRAPDVQQRCRTVQDSDAQIIGYDVTYDYEGREFSTRLDHDPGRWLTVGEEIRDDGVPLASAYSEPPVSSAPGQAYYDRR